MRGGAASGGCAFGIECGSTGEGEVYSTQRILSGPFCYYYVAAAECLRGAACLSAMLRDAASSDCAHCIASR